MLPSAVWWTPIPRGAKPGRVICRTMFMRSCVLTASDDTLAKNIALGEPGALDELYSKYGRMAYALALRIIGDSGFAEDVVQEVFLGLWRNPGSFNAARGSYASWLLSITHHKAVDVVRREEALRRRRDAQRTQVVLDFGRTDDSGGVDEQVMASLRQQQVRGALLKLPTPQREALLLAYFGGYTQAEVASLTKAPLGTVKTRMVAGMRKLAAVLSNGGDQSSDMGGDSGPRDSQTGRGGAQ